LQLDFTSSLSKFTVRTGLLGYRLQTYKYTDQSLSNRLGVESRYVGNYQGADRWRKSKADEAEFSVNLGADAQHPDEADHQAKNPSRGPEMGQNGLSGSTANHGNTGRQHWIR